MEQNMELYLQLILLILLRVTITSARDAEAELIRKVTSDYVTDARPVYNHTDVVVVDFNLAIYLLADLQEKEHLVKTAVWVRLKWLDKKLKWNPADYEEINRITINPSKIWVPDIILYNEIPSGPSGLQGAEDVRLTITHLGNVSFNYPAVIQSSCRIDVNMFPWDKQVCELKFGSWAYVGTQVDLTNNTETDLSTFPRSEQSEWKLNSAPTVRHINYFSCCEEPFIDVTVYLHLTRQPGYYMINLLLPCIVLIILSHVAFILPVESGEKLSLSITVLLALTVFQLVVADMTPQSNTPPLIGSYFAMVLILLSICVLMTVFVLHVHHRGNLKLRAPRWLRVFMLKWLSAVFCLRRVIRVNARDNLENTNKPSVVLTGHNADSTKRTPNGQTSMEQTDEISDEQMHFEWMAIALIIDRICLIFMLILTGVVFGILFSKLSVPDDV